MYSKQFSILSNIKRLFGYYLPYIYSAIVIQCSYTLSLPLFIVDFIACGIPVLD